MTMFTMICIIAALLVAGFVAVRFFGKSAPESESEVMRVTRKNRSAVPKPE